MGKNARKGRLVGAGVALLVFIAIMLSLMFGMQPPAEKTAERTVTDLAGRKVALPENVERLIALGPGALRLVAYLGATDRIVGIEDFEKRMARDPFVRPYAITLGEKVLALPVVGTGGPGALPDVERTLMCRPDAIVAVGLDPAQLDNIRTKTGVPTLYLSYGDLGVWRDEARRSLSLLGEVLNENERAAAVNEYIALLERDLEKRTAGIAEANRPRVYFGGISHKGSHGLTSTEAGYPPGKMAGAWNLVEELDKTGHFFVDKEQILVWDPDVIFVDAASRLILDKDFAENRGFYRLLTASKFGRVFSLLPYNYYNTNIELALLNAYFVGKTLYPDRFADIAMQDKAREIMDKLLGVCPDGDLPAFGPLIFPEAGPVEWRRHAGN